MTDKEIEAGIKKRVSATARRRQLVGRLIRSLLSATIWGGLSTASR